MWAKCGLKYYIWFMAKINFLIQTKNNPAGIYVRLRDGRKIDAKVKTRFAIDPKDWSIKKGQPRTLKDEALKKLHSDLEILKINLLKHYNNRVENIPINTDWLKAFLNPVDNIESIPTKLVEHITYYTKICSA